VPFRIRQFAKADFPTLWQIDQACFDPQLAYSQAEMAFYMRRPGSFTLVAEATVDDRVNANDKVKVKLEHKVLEHRVLEHKVKDRNQVDPARRNGSMAEIGSSVILGFIIAESRRRAGHIITIDVVADARRTGVGSALLQAAEENLLRAGATTVALETPVNNAAAIRFYKSEGYFLEKTVSGYYSNQMDALVMTKDLA
jgi:ribosomal protein S18 acetylase RimI-like enzyme